MAKTRIITEPGLPQVVVTREFDASPELLFRAHTDSKLFVQWLGPRGLTMAIDHLDVREGGTWHYTSREVNGNEYGYHGVYHATPSPDGMVQFGRERGINDSMERRDELIVKLSPVP